MDAARSYMKKRLVISGGGTGGHVFPALAVAEVLSDTCEIFWIGSRKGIEARIVTERGIPFHSVPSGKLRRYFSWQNFTDAFRIFGGLLASLVILAKLKPHALFSKGGFVTVPPVLAARILGIPVISHESDFDPGLATRINAKSSCRICVPYPETLAFFTGGLAKKVRHTGNPVRRDIFSAQGSFAREELMASAREKPLFFVQGGSLGARQINETLREVLPLLKASGWFVIHQRGDAPWDIADEPGFYLSRPFFSSEYGSILAASNLVLSRAGAGSIWEMGVMKKPAVLLPLDGGSRGDQIRNAAHCERSGAALVLPQVDSAVVLARFVEELAGPGGVQRLEAMAGAWALVVRTDGAEQVARVIREVLDERD